MSPICTKSSETRTSEITAFAPDVAPFMLKAVVIVPVFAFLINTVVLLLDMTVPKKVLDPLASWNTISLFANAPVFDANVTCNTG